MQSNLSRAVVQSGVETQGFSFRWCERFPGCSDTPTKGVKQNRAAYGGKKLIVSSGPEATCINQLPNSACAHVPAVQTTRHHRHVKLCNYVPKRCARWRRSRNGHLGTRAGARLRKCTLCNPRFGMILAPAHTSTHGGGTDAARGMLL